MSSAVLGAGWVLWCGVDDVQVVGFRRPRNVTCSSQDTEGDISVNVFVARSSSTCAEILMHVEGLHLVQAPPHSHAQPGTRLSPPISVLLVLLLFSLN